MSWFTEYAFKFLTNFLKPSLKSRLAYVDKIEQIQELVDLYEIPDHSGGFNSSYVRIPDGVKSGKCLQHLSQIGSKEWDVFRELNMDSIVEGMREVNDTSIDHYLRTCQTNGS